MRDSSYPQSTNRQNQNPYHGIRIADYIIDQYIGTGTISTVYKVHKQNHPYSVNALKIFSAEISQDNNFLGNLEHTTATIASQKGKPSLRHILSLEECSFVSGTNTALDGCAYLVMEYMDQGSLESNSKNMSLRDIINSILCAAQGLEAVLKQDLIPPNLHGRNILLGSNNELKLSDYGLSPPTAPSTSQLAKTLHHMATGTEIDKTPSQYPEQKQSSGQEQNTLPALITNLVYDCLAADPDRKPGLSQFIKTLQLTLYTELNPEYQAIMQPAAAEMKQIIHKSKQNPTHTLLPINIKDLYKIRKKTQHLLQKRGFPADFHDELESLQDKAFEADLREISGFLGQPSNQSTQSTPTINQIRATAQGYISVLSSWQEHTKTTIRLDLKSGTIEITQKEPPA